MQSPIALPPSIQLNDYLLECCSARYDRVRAELAANSDGTTEGVLTDLIEVCYGKDHKNLDDGKYPVYGSGGLMRHVEEYLHDGESVLIPRKGTLNNVMIVRDRFWTVDTMFYTKELFTGAARYAYFFLAKLNLASMNAGSAVPSMTTKILSAIPMPIPSVAILGELKSWSDSLFKQIRLNEKENEELAQIRNVLLPKLMVGEIDVSKIELPTQPNNHLTLPLTPREVCLDDEMTGKSNERAAMETTINAILAQMQPFLGSQQIKQLKHVLHLELIEKMRKQPTELDEKLLPLFLTAKEVEGCSPKTIAYYESTLMQMTRSIPKPYTQIDSNDLRKYLNNYEINRGAGKVTIDNIRRIMSSFFAWLEDEDYIVKSPVRRIHRVKTATVTKEVLSDEELETLRDSCSTPRDLAIVDLLASTGMRVGELVGLDISDIDLQERECIVTGKGNKQRPVYFDARTKNHLTAYLNSRDDNNPALFISLNGDNKRISIGSIQTRLRNLGKSAGIKRVYPHKFRRTLATHAIDKGMPIEQVQKLLGHAKIDTTMHYAMVNQNNVKASHRRYLE